MKKCTYVIFFIFCAHAVSAQVSNTSNSFTISSGTEVTILAPSVSNSGTITNAGTIAQSGEWTNIGTLTNSSSGSVSLTGDMNNTGTITNDGNITGVNWSNGGTLRNNSNLTLSGNFTAAGAILNEGALTLAGNWQSTSTYVGAGNLLMNGADQSLLHVGAISNLSMVGAGLKTISQDLEVTGTLLLTNGIINATAGDVIVSGSISGGGETSYVNGALFQNAALNTTYPIGTASAYLPATFSNLNAVGSMGLMINSGTLAFNRDTLNTVAPYYYEILQDRGGVFTDANVSIPASALGFNAADLVIAQSAAASDEATNIGGVVNGDNVSNVDPLTAVLFTPAEEASIRITIMNVLTPNGDLINSSLYIRNIEFFPNNEVKILNRWGARVAVIQGYDNLTNFWAGTKEASTDLVGAGNYVCVVLNKDTGKQLGKQTITIFR